MKHLLTACVVAGTLTATAGAEGPANIYAEVNRTGEVNSATVGTGFELGGQGLFVEGTVNEAEDYSARLYANFEVFSLAVQPGATYSWGESGGDLIGLGDGNEWGTVAADVEAVYTVGIIGEEYVFLGSSATIDEGFTWEGGDFGVGYLFETESGVYLDARMVWGFSSDYEFTEDSTLSLTLGMSF